MHAARLFRMVSFFSVPSLAFLNYQLLWTFQRKRPISWHGADILPVYVAYNYCTRKMQLSIPKCLPFFFTPNGLQLNAAKKLQQIDTSFRFMKPDLASCKEYCQNQISMNLLRASWCRRRDATCVPMQHFTVTGAKQPGWGPANRLCFAHGHLAWQAW